MAAERQLLELVVRQVLDHVQQLRIGAPEMLAQIRAGLDGIFLVLAVDDFAHPLHEEPVAILRQQRVPVAAPQALDHVPARAAEHRFELLDDLAVAAHRAVQPLEVAVDHEDQVVQLLARGQRDGAERFGLVGFAVAQERPHLRGAGRLLQPAVFEIADEARLVDRHDGAEPHRDARVFPEIGHQPRMRIRGQPAAGIQLAPEILQLLLGETALEKRARVDAGRGVPLVEHHVAVAVVAGRAPEMVEPHFVERGGRRKRRNMPADAGLGLVRAHHHRDGVPADQTLDFALELLAAGKRRFLIGGDGIDVRRVGAERKADAAAARVRGQVLQQLARAGRAVTLKDVVERFEPFLGFYRLEVGDVLGGNVSH